MKRGALLFGVALALIAGPALAKETGAKAAHKQAKTEPSAAKLRRESEHVVREGETIGGIANRAEVPRVLIVEANHLKPPYALHTGQRLVIPRRRSHVVKDGETALGIAMDYGMPWHAIALANGLDPKAELKAGQKLAIPTLAKGAPGTAQDAPAKADRASGPQVDLSTADKGDKADKSDAAASPPADKGTPPVSFAWPVNGKIRRGFVPRKGKSEFHDGIDILADEGTAVRASAAGKVIFAGDGPSEYGHTVVIHHGGRWTTVYSYLQKITVKLGDKVKAGERVGLVGQSGLAKEPQLHFEIRHARYAADPIRWLPKAKAD